MPARRKSARPTSIKQPVRFYKFVALTFLLITVVLFGVILFMSAKRAEIIITTSSEPIEAAFSVDVGPDESKYGVVGAVDTAVISINENYSPDGNKKEEAQATGVVTIYNESSREQPLVKTTRLLTDDDLLFRLSEGVIVPANDSVQARMYADEKGSSGNIGPSDFTIPGLNPARQQVIYAKSSEPTVGGIVEVGVLSQSDLTRAEQLAIDTAQEKAQEVLGDSHDGMVGVYTVSDTALQTTASLGEEVDLFDLSGKVIVVGVFYDKDSLEKYARSMLEKQVVDDSEQLQSVSSDLAVTVVDHNLDAGSATLNVTHSGRVNLDANSPGLDTKMFFGKTEDEVRRYVMSLDHVQGVKVNFKPVWNRSVPHTPDHISVVVRQVE